MPRRRAFSSVSWSMFLRCTVCGASNELPASTLGAPLRCSRCRQAVLAPAHALVVAAADAKEIVRDAPWSVLVDFWSPASEPSRQAAPEVERFARRHQGHLLVLKVNADIAAEWSRALHVQALPTYVLFRQGAELRRTSGALSAEQLEVALLPAG
jgi:thiol-disulfide isomerase/thioredoxin